MQHVVSLDEQRRRAAAADWFARLGGPSVGVDEALAFDAWLSADPGNAAAYDEMLAVAETYAAHAPEVLQSLAARAAARPARRGWLAGLGAAAAAGLALAVSLPQLASDPPATTYVTSVGQHRSLRLADGSAVDLDGGTRISVSLGRHARRLTLAEGQAVFDVAHDTRRPFLIAAGDRTVRVVGTQFDVRRRDGRLAVTVARGVVEVRPSEGADGAAYRLHPGQRLDHEEGAASARISATDPAEALAWRSGRLAYRGQPLSEVIADLNQQFPIPIRIADPGLAATPISGVFVLDDQDAVIRRLALLVPLRAIRSDGELVLRRAGAAK